MIAYIDGGYDNIRKRNPYFSYKLYTDDHQMICWVQREFVDATTNNEAEYQALIHLLIYLARMNTHEHITIYSDSSLVVNQVNGNWKINKHNLQLLYNIVDSIIGIDYDLVWVSREEIVKELGH